MHQMDGFFDVGQVHGVGDQITDVILSVHTPLSGQTDVQGN